MQGAGERIARRVAAAVVRGRAVRVGAGECIASRIAAAIG